MARYIRKKNGAAVTVPTIFEALVTSPSINHIQNNRLYEHIILPIWKY
jgi:hypothetical protein